jgi:hypothetical protein
MPEPAPVTKATLPSNEIFILLLCYFSSFPMFFARPSPFDSRATGILKQAHLKFSRDHAQTVVFLR